MRPLHRALTTAVAVTVATVVVGGVPAGAIVSTPNGVGSTTTTTSVLSLSLGTAGNLLRLGILTDQGQSSIDPHTGTLGASTSLIPLTVDSAATGLHVAAPGLSTKAPGGASDVGGNTLTLASLGVPAALASAEIDPAALHSDYSPTAAHSNIAAAQIKNLTIAGGALASIDLLSSNLTADALSTQADGLRGVQVGTIKLLDLGALLKGLGTNLTALPLSTVDSLLSSLSLSSVLPAGTSLTALDTAITGLQATVTSTLNSNSTATSLSTNPTTTTTNALQQVTSSLTAATAARAAAVTIPTVGTSIATVDALITQLTGTLSNLLNTALPALDSFPLLQVSATSVGITTRAADTLANSAAGVTVLPLTLTAAGIPLNVDLAGAVNTVNTTIASANTALNGVLHKIGLPANLVSLDLLQQAHSVSQNGSYTLASAGVNVATLKIAAIDPAAVVSGITALGGPSVSSVLSSLGTATGPVLAATNAMTALNSALGQVAPLTGGAQVQIASLSGASTYTVAPTAVPTGSPNAPSTSLPHTGGNPALALLGVMFAILAFAGVRWTRSTGSVSARR